VARVARGPKFVQYFDPVLQALKQLGGSARPGEVVEVVARLKGVSEAQRQEVLQSGALRFDNQVAFARQYLVWGGYLDSSKRGVWSLTEKGLACPGLSDTEAIQVFREQHALHSSAARKDEADAADGEAPLAELPEGYKAQLLNVLRHLPPGGFERLCQRLLRESDFEQVQVTGRSGDGGIDGIGIVKVNAFVTFKVLFQCKRYAGGVSAGHVRDFRGAMQGRADKGIILTTGTFTKDAHAEAVRDGVPPIELVDGEQLVELFEQLELGLLPRKTYDVDAVFFEQFREPTQTPVATSRGATPVLANEGDGSRRRQDS
jgi:restriction system protein